MTEPTHHLRPDVSAQLDMILARVMSPVGHDQLDLARERLCRYLASAWHAGWMAGHANGSEHELPTPNPYHETDIR
jgi:hypothetical protein